MPGLVKVHERFRDRKDFVMIGINRDYEESELREYLKGHPEIAWAQVFGEKGGVPAANETFGVSGIPRSSCWARTEGSLRGVRGEQVMAVVEQLMDKDRPTEGIGQQPIAQSWVTAGALGAMETGHRHHFPGSARCGIAGACLWRVRDRRWRCCNPPGSGA